MQFGQVQSSPVWGGGKLPHLEGEEHLKVLNCKAENLMQSLNVGVPIVYNTTLLLCTNGSLSFVVNQQATN